VRKLYVALTVCMFTFQDDTMKCFNQYL